MADSKIKKIQDYLKKTRRELNAAMKRDGEYNTSLGNGINSHEASSMFDEVEEEIGKIIKE